MTRFARAKGSKASNERAPEDSTPWEVMKDQLIKSKKVNEEAKKREEAEKQRISNYENFLKERKVQKRKATWCEFPETFENTNTQGEIKKKKKDKFKPKTTEVTNIEVCNDINSNNQISTENVQHGNLDEPKIKKKKNKVKKVNKLNSENKEEQLINNHSEVPLNGQSESVTQISKKNKKVKKSKLNSDNIVSATENVQVFNQNAKRTENKRNNESKKNKKDKKKERLKNGEPVRRKPINDRSFQLIINGKEVELIRFEGFPIMKKDAERLEELKTSMVKKGIPKSEVQRTIKLERRRAEKALARLKRDVCYNCRKGGHNLSDCPELKSKIPGVDSAEGVCFKCGSTEHRQFECKVQRDKEFRFATCFICKEAGHIARQCPDNPRGLYPNGGSCKLCGDVTHLRKDCPTIKGNNKEETSIKLQTLDNAENVEGIESNFKSSSKETVKKPKKIKF